MKVRINKKSLIVFTTLTASVIIASSLINHKKVDYNSEVKPLFNKKCISCHGGVKKESGFSLLFRAEALDTTDSGKPAIVPGHPEKSEIIKRLTSSDPEYRMPYNHERLSSEEISILKRWVKEGAVWGQHWAYTPLQPVKVPSDKGFWSFLQPGKEIWGNNDIDHFIYDKLIAEKLAPSPKAGKNTLLRRVSLDITGIPPSAELSRQFLSDDSPRAYEKLVDSLLASPHYGEKWTALWLDLARYADTKGYERDPHRSIWRYRDWLINAFNSNMPYDQFLTEQLAGDLLPNATEQQYLATAFQRNSMTNDEGGSDNEEYRTAAIVDRVNAVWETLMGTTFGCVQCHSHPYDPFKNEEYYRFMAFFNNTRDEDTYDDYPLLREFTSPDSARLAGLDRWLLQHATSDREKEIITFLRTWQPSVNSIRADQFVRSALLDTKWLYLENSGSARLANIDLTGKTSLIIRYMSEKKNGKLTVHLDSLRGRALTSITAPSHAGWDMMEAPLLSINGIHNLYLSYNNPTESQRSESSLIGFDWFYFTTDFPGKGTEGYSQALNSYRELMKAKPAVVTPVMMENPVDMFRPTFVFERGSWLSKGKKVSADVPGSLNAFPKQAPLNRLGLAQWMTSKQNPLTARTLVNRIWEQLMGQGIAETLEDLGSQGLPPTHQPLLDWLSWQFIQEDGWRLKTLIKKIVMSATYQQDSKLTKESLQKDPFNKYYARGPRVRLSAEQIRDQALFVSGLLSPKMFGQSVMPYQPNGIWLSPYDGNKWEQSKGEDQYRRALYTYWKRTAPYPSMISFDGVAREICLARRIRTNTPLQALATLNDSAYIDMARHLAKRMQREGGKDYRQQISKGFELAVYRPIDKEKLDALVVLYLEAVRTFSNDKKKAAALIAEGPQHADAAQAALTLVGNAILNMDEFITKN